MWGSGGPLPEKKVRWQMVHLEIDLDYKLGLCKKLINTLCEGEKVGWGVGLVLPVIVV